jgi:hypothetical protein
MKNPETTAIVLVDNNHSSTYTNAENLARQTISHMESVAAKLREDVERLREMVEATAKQRTKMASTHQPGGLYSMQEIAALWAIGVDKARELFKNEPDVVKLQTPAKKGKRGYTTLRVPEKVEERLRMRYGA